jgi:hypothetical protein
MEPPRDKFRMNMGLEMSKLSKMVVANFYEKALFVKSRRGGRPVANATALCPSRYASIRTLRELTLFGGSVHRMRSDFSARQKALQSSERPYWRVGQVRIAQSPY